MFENLRDKNRIAVILTVLALIIMIVGIIAGFSEGYTEVTMHHGDETIINKDFSLEVAATYWFASIVSGVCMLGFAEIINLLEDIKKK